jgi:hypothetical protein
MKYLKDNRFTDRDHASSPTEITRHQQRRYFMFLHKFMNMYVLAWEEAMDLS